MTRNYYQISLPERHVLLLEQHFTKDPHRIWRHPDGRALGEGVAAALTDESFLRYLGLEAEKRAEPADDDEETLLVG